MVTGPIALTDRQLDAVKTVAARLPTGLRQTYLREVAAALRGRPFDDGDVYRAAQSAARAVAERYRHDGE